MKIGMRSLLRQKKVILAPAIMLAIALMTFGFLRLSKSSWADNEGMTELWFNSSLFCQRVSVAINDSLGSGTADGRRCPYGTLYVSSTSIPNIKELTIVPAEDDWNEIDWDIQPMDIGGNWVYVFDKLESLSLAGMHVQEISPLRNLASASLTYLDLSSNQISDITPLEALSNRLVYLDLSNNQVGGSLSSLGGFEHLEILKLKNTSLGTLAELFQPPEEDEEPYDEEGEEPSPRETSTKLAKVLQLLDISDNIGLAREATAEDEEPVESSLAAFSACAEDLVLSKLYATRDGLSTNDLRHIAALGSLAELDVSDNHIEDFSSIRYKAYTALKADSQTFVRSVDGLDYGPLPAIFEQAQTANYLGIANAPNDALAPSQLSLDNAQFYGAGVRFINAATASEYSGTPRPATVMIPAGTGVFANSKLQVYFTGQVATFNDTNLCNLVYDQGDRGTAFVDINGESSWTPEDGPIVLTNACSDTPKQIAMISGGSSRFLRLTLNNVNGGAWVDLTGLEQFDNLQVLSMQYNSLTSIEAIRNALQLQRLELNNNNLNRDSWQTINNFTSLRLLNLNNNNLTEISTELGNMSQLGSLYLANNGLSDVSPLAQASTVTVLDLSKNSGISDFSGMVQNDSRCNPVMLMLEDAGITNLPSASIMASFTNLTYLNLDGNQITDATIANLASAPKLDELYLSRNQITNTTGLSGVTKLKKLSLDNNQITDISGLTSLERLAELHLSHNQIADLTGLNSLPVLATLDLTNQTLTDAADDELYSLPPVFSQAKTMTFSRVSGFRSLEDYAITNGTINYDGMVATIANTNEAMTITIPDGSLAGTTITVTYDAEFTPTITNYTRSDTTTSLDGSTLTITSSRPCIVLATTNSGTSYTRLPAQPTGSASTYTFNVDLSQPSELIVAYLGDINLNGSVNSRDSGLIDFSLLSTSNRNYQALTWRY